MSLKRSLVATALLSLGNVVFAAADDVTVEKGLVQFGHEYVMLGDHHGAGITKHQKLVKAKPVTEAAIDKGFGNNGVVKIEKADFSVGAVNGLGERNGQLYLAYYGNQISTNAVTSGALRFNSNGTLDSSYVSQLPFINGATDYYFAFLGTTLDSNGKVVATGYRRNPHVDPTIAYTRTPILARFASNGALDTTYNGTGLIVQPATTNYVAVQDSSAQGEGRILIAGVRYDRNADGSRTNRQSYIERYHSDGTLDTSFADEGLLLLSDTPNRIAVAADNSIYVTSLIGTGPNPDELVWTTTLYHYSANGDLDEGFGGTGALELEGYSAFTIATGKNQKIYLAGDAENGSVTWIGRVNPSGTLDATFGSGGIASEENEGALWSVHELANDQLLVAGDTYELNDRGAASYTYVAKLKSNGDIDRAFGNEGRAIVAEDAYLVQDAILQADGKLVLPMRCAQSTEAEYSCLKRVKTNAESDDSSDGGGSLPLLSVVASLLLLLKRRTNKK